MVSISIHDLNRLTENPMRFRNGIVPNILKEQPDIQALTDAFAEQEQDSFSFQSQEQTGYCWLIAALNCIAAYTCQKYKFPSIHFSKNYLIFYDKVEKVNWFLEHILDTLDMPSDSRELHYLLSHAFSDHGQWHMAENLIGKYGLVPGEIMTDIPAAQNTQELNTCLGMLLRSDAARLRELSSRGALREQILDEKKAMLQDAVSILCNCFGAPPQKFICPAAFGGKPDEAVTPMEFYRRYIAFPFDDYVSIYDNGTAADSEYIEEQVLLDGNVIGGKPDSFIRVPQDIFHEAVRMQVEEQHFCWFGCDSGRFFFKNYNIYDDSCLDIQKFSPLIPQDLPKDWIRLCSIASLNHAIVLHKSAQVQGRIWWQALNSARNSAQLGWCYLSDHWLRQYGFQAVVQKNFLPQACLNLPRRVRLPWDAPGGF